MTSRLSVAIAIAIAIVWLCLASVVGCGAPGGTDLARDFDGLVDFLRDLDAGRL